MITWKPISEKERIENLKQFKTIDNKTTDKFLGELSQKYLSTTKKKYMSGDADFIRRWPEVAKRYASMSKAFRFKDGVLSVKVHNSMVLHMITMEKNILIEKLKLLTNNNTIEDIKFYFG